MNTTLPSLHDSGSKILLSEDSPLFFLNMAFPGGISVPDWLLSINGQDFYEVEFDEVYEKGLWNRVAGVLYEHGQDDYVGYCLSQYFRIPIPSQWAIAISGGQQK